MNENQVLGTLADIKFQQGHFIIGILNHGVTVKGNILSPIIGREYQLTGRWDRHPKWGDQFAFNDYRSNDPTDTDAIEMYLVENYESIDPDLIKNLIEVYGDETLTVCKHEPERIVDELPGFSLRRAKELSVQLRNHDSEEGLHLALKDLLSGISVNGRIVPQLIEKWGPEAPERIRHNPFDLIGAIDGIGFYTADQVAKRLGLAFDGSPRIRAGVVHTLKEQAFGNGNTCLPRGVLLSEAMKVLRIPQSKIDGEIDPLIQEGILVDTEEVISLQSFHDDETLISKKLKVLTRAAAQPGCLDLDGLAEDQREALEAVMLNDVAIITGPPGTGKTFMIKKILESFPEAQASLTAPTGKAAKRMYEQTGHVAKTIHRLLDPQKVDGKFVFTRNAENPLEADLVIVDEVSMVDTSLMARLLEAIVPGTRLVLVGDVYQLPPVGPGNVLKDLIASGMIPSTELSIIKRQDEGLIVRNCHQIKNGRDIEYGDSNNTDFFFIRRGEEASIRETLIDLVSRRLPESYDVDPLQDIQVITPLREKTELSCKALNKIFQERINPEPEIKGCRFKVGDKVIQTRNEYDLDIMNGDIGYVLEVDKMSRNLTVGFENPERIVNLSLFQNDLTLAYAITAHKFQGSEARIIVIPIHRSFGIRIMQRHWLYTAISRAQQICVLVGHREEIPKIIRRDQQQHRFTRLKEMLL